MALEVDLAVSDADPHRMLAWLSFLELMGRIADLLFDEQLVAARDETAAVPHFHDSLFAGRLPWEGVPLAAKLQRLLSLCQTAWRQSSALHTMVAAGHGDAEPAHAPPATPSRAPTPSGRPTRPTSSLSGPSDGGAAALDVAVDDMPAALASMLHRCVVHPSSSTVVSTTVAVAAPSRTAAPPSSADTRAPGATAAPGLSVTDGGGGGGGVGDGGGAALASSVVAPLYASLGLGVPLPPTRVFAMASGVVAASGKGGKGPGGGGGGAGKGAGKVSADRAPFCPPWPSTRCSSCNEPSSASRSASPPRRTAS